MFVQSGTGSLLLPDCSRLRCKQYDDHVMVSAKKGAFNRLGYTFTHSAIVIICIGGLVDGNLPLKWRAFTGDIRIETRDIPASEVPAESRLSKHNPSFRGSVNIPEGSSANLVFLNLRDGYLLQSLPVSLKSLQIPWRACCGCLSTRGLMLWSPMLMTRCRRPI